MTMPVEDPDTIIADLHRVRAQMAAEFGGDVFAITADARLRMEKSGREVWRCSQSEEGTRKPDRQPAKR